MLKDYNWKNKKTQMEQNMKTSIESTFCEWDETSLCIQ